MLDRDGRFWHDGRPVEHRSMAEGFARWVDRHPDDGRFILNNGYDWTYLKVEGAPLFVNGLRPQQGAVVLQLMGGVEEVLDPALLALDDAGVVHALLRGGTMVARFRPAAQAELAPYLVAGSDGSAEFELSGTRHAFRPLAKLPQSLTVSAL